MKKRTNKEGFYFKNVNFFERREIKLENIKYILKVINKKSEADDQKYLYELIIIFYIIHDL
jgi:hypothetical protein